MIIDNFLFKAVVTRINLQDSPNSSSSAINGSTIKGTFDCRAEIPRLDLRNVRMLSPNASLASFTQLGASQPSLNPSGFFHLPNIGDVVICAFLNGYPDLPVCLGSLFIVGNPATALPDPASSVADTASFQRQDAVWMHESGAYIRFRNLNIQPGNVLNPELGARPQITLFHSTGTEFNLVQNTDGTISSSLVTKAGNYTVTDGSGNTDSLINGQWTVQVANSILWRNFKNMASISITAGGAINIMDAQTNLLRMDTDGIVVQDMVNSNFMSMDSNGITLIDSYSNVFVMDSNGISMRAPGSNINIVGDSTVNIVSPAVTIGAGTSSYDNVAMTTPLVTLLNVLVSHTHPIVFQPVVGSVTSGSGSGGLVAGTVSGATAQSPLLTPFNPVLNTQIGSGALSAQSPTVPI